MKNNKLIDLLRRLNSNEWKAFAKFLKSPYFNSNKKLVLLHADLTRYYPGFSNKNFTKEKVYKNLFPKSAKVDEKQLANLMSQMRKCCDAFFVQQRLKEKPRLSSQLLGEYYGEQNWYDLLEKNTKSLLSEIESTPRKTEEDYFIAYMTNLAFYHHPETLKLNATSPSFNKAIEYLSEFSILEILKLGCELKTRAYFLSDKSEVLMLNEVVLYSEKLDLIEVKVYRSFIQLLEDDSDEQYAATSALFFELMDDLGKQDKLNLFNILLNLTNRIALNGDSSYYHHLFELYKSGLENDFFLIKGLMNTNHFTNVVTVGAYLGEFDWVGEFITTYQNLLIPEDQQVVIAYCRARIAIEESSYKQAFNYLIEIEEVQHKFSFRVRSLFLRCLYDLFEEDDTYYDLLISKTLSFMKYIHRDKVWDVQRKKSYLRFCHILQQLVDLGSNKNDKIIKKINDGLHQQPVIAKDWLLRKLDHFV